MKKILNHISHARDWLNKAEQKVLNDEIVAGEVFLSLAEAEIRKAWEGSYYARKRTNKKVSMVAAIIMLVFAFAVGVNMIFDSYSQPEPLRLSLAETREERLTFQRTESSLRLINYNLSINNK